MSAWSSSPEHLLCLSAPVSLTKLSQCSSSPNSSFSLFLPPLGPSSQTLRLPSSLFSLPPFFTVCVFSAKGFGTSGPSIMHSRNQLLTNRPVREPQTCQTPAEPYTSPSCSCLSAPALSEMCVCLCCINLTVGRQHRVCCFYKMQKKHTQQAEDGQRAAELFVKWDTVGGSHHVCIWMKAPVRSLESSSSVKWKTWWSDSMLSCFVHAVYFFSAALSLHLGV